MLQSPLNYTGGKYRLLPQLLPLFPKKIRAFYDLFAGGCNVAINVQAGRFICTDVNGPLILLYQTFQHVAQEEIFRWIFEIIDAYGLSLVSRHGYAHYQSEGSKGLAAFNREPFLRLRSDFNASTAFDYRYYVMLYVIIVYAFNNQIRFNAQGEYNLPVGKRDFNEKMQKKLTAFIERIQTGNFEFRQQDFRALNLSSLSPTDFVYADPPYLITCAAYNENGGWGEAEEKALLALLDELNARGIPFALSNVLASKGKHNYLLTDWAAKAKGKYRVHHLDHSYANANYHRKGKETASDEVLITNYQPQGGGQDVH